MHEHGLGALGVGAALDGPVSELLAAADNAALTWAIRSAFWRVASSAQTEIDLKAGGEQRARLEKLLSATISQGEIEVSRSTAELEHLRLALEEKERQAAELMAHRAAERSEKAQLGMALAEARSERVQIDMALAAGRSRNAELGTAVAATRSENAKLGTALR